LNPVSHSFVAFLRGVLTLDDRAVRPEDRDGPLAVLPDRVAAVSHQRDENELVLVVVKAALRRGKRLLPEKARFRAGGKRTQQGTQGEEQATHKCRIYIIVV
jgi:hypothetical protein